MTTAAVPLPVSRCSVYHCMRALCTISLFALPCAAGPQSASTTTNQATKQTAAGKTEESPASPGFSIESEMLTYTAMQSDSEAIACDVERFGDFADGNCQVRKAADLRSGIVVLSSQSRIFSDFQLWASDLAAMDMLLLRAKNDCPLQQPGAQGQRTNLGGTSSVNALASLTPAGQAISLAKALLASDESTLPVGGNIGDEALVNGIARQLRSAGISVLAPDLYLPFSLARIDPLQSPFLEKLNALTEARSACETSPTTAAAERQATFQAIGDFLDTVSGVVPRAPEKLSSPPPNPAGAQTQPASPHLISVLRADGLARAMLGSGPASQDPPFQHVLWIKALESGGSVNRSPTLGLAVFGTRISFTGGSVVTYALFNMNGEVECSGTVYDYEGSLRPKAIHGMVRSNPSRANSIGSCNPAQQ